MKPFGRGGSNSDLFRERLDAIIDMHHILVRLAAFMPWSAFDESFGKFFKPNRPSSQADTADGRAALPEAHLQPFRRGGGGALGGECLLAVFLAALSSFSTRCRSTPPRCLLAQAGWPRGPGEGDGEAVEPGAGDGGHNGSAQSDRASHRQSALSEGATHPGRQGEKGRHQASSKPHTLGQESGDEGGALCACQAVPAHAPRTQTLEDLSRPGVRDVPVCSRIAGPTFGASLLQAGMSAVRSTVIST